MLICSRGVTTMAESTTRSTDAGVADTGGATGGCSTTDGDAGFVTGAATDVVAPVVASVVLNALVVSAFGVAGRRDDEKNLGVTTITSAINTSARMVRLSMQVSEVAKEPDRSRRAGKGDSARFAAQPTMYRAARHAAGVLQWRMLSSLDNNGTTMAVVARAPPGSHVPSIRGRCAFWLHTRLGADQSDRHGDDIGA